MPVDNVLDVFEESVEDDPLNGDISVIGEESFIASNQQMSFDENTPFEFLSSYPPPPTSSPKVHFLIPASNLVLTKPPTSALKGMTYNPRTFRWEGNEQAVRDFETPQPPSTPPTTITARPALISNVSSTKNVQVVGGMVFDPSRMCWLKVTEDSEGESERDPFEGLDDLDDSTSRVSGGTHADCGEFVVGEEFDVGPMFVANQREEEKRWRAKVEGWIAPQVKFNAKQKWELRDLVMKSVERAEMEEMEAIPVEAIGIAV